MGNTYNMEGGLWLRLQESGHIQIHDENIEQSIMLYIPQGDVEDMIDGLRHLAAQYEHGQQVERERERLAAFVEGKGIPGEVANG